MIFSFFKVRNYIQLLARVKYDKNNNRFFLVNKSLKRFYFFSLFFAFTQLLITVIVGINQEPVEGQCINTRSQITNGIYWYIYNLKYDWNAQNESRNSYFDLHKIVQKRRFLKKTFNEFTTFILRQIQYCCMAITY